MTVILQLVEKRSDEFETGSSDSLLSELKMRFENSISGFLGTKTIVNIETMIPRMSTQTVDGQKQKLEESDKALEQRKTLVRYEDCLPS